MWTMRPGSRLSHEVANAASARRLASRNSRMTTHVTRVWQARLLNQMQQQKGVTRVWQPRLLTQMQQQKGARMSRMTPAVTRVWQPWLLHQFQQLKGGKRKRCLWQHLSGKRLVGRASKRLCGLDSRPRSRGSRAGLWQHLSGKRLRIWFVCTKHTASTHGQNASRATSKYSAV